MSSDVSGRNFAEAFCILLLLVKCREDLCANFCFLLNLLSLMMGQDE